ncbi:hypothetical protein [Nitratireductor luteus]|uniref:hypothetical protein n=1 Tax=Nitratireductor luteus TaxID=2976980 RepID=UPI00223ECFE9|nr:hypothetical protein [Nitratireductor luteus]
MPGLSILSDEPDHFDPYPVEVIELSAKDKSEFSFGDRYHFGIKAAGVIQLLKRCDRLFFMDTDIYPIGSIAHAFDMVSPTHSVMRFCEGRPHYNYAKLGTADVSIGGERLAGTEPMWNSGIIGVHRSNLTLLEDAYFALRKVIAVVDAHTPEQFCVGVALSRGGRAISPHRLPLRHYSTSGKKSFAGPRIVGFFEEHGCKSVREQIELASRVRLRRSPLDLLARLRRQALAPPDTRKPPSP